jgi:hypothetical protein
MAKRGEWKHNIIVTKIGRSKTIISKTGRL